MIENDRLTWHEHRLRDGTYSMKLSNSLGFLFIGSVMFLLPQVAPNLCPAGFSVRATWLHVMGLFQFGIGVSFLMQKAGGELAGWLGRWPELIAVPVTGPETDPATQAGLPAFPHRLVAQPLAEVIPLDFKPAWSEQRHAA